MEGKVRKREKRVRIRVMEWMKRMTGMRVKLVGKPLKKEAQKA